MKLTNTVGGAMRGAMAAIPLALLAACVTAPTGPSVMALPGHGKNFDQFRADDADCRSFAQSQIGGTTAAQSADDSGVRSAALGTAVGAVAGAAIGGHQGAGVGAGVGLLGGTLAGTGAAQGTAHTVQQRYDNAYVQCMYAKGENVPVGGRIMSSPARMTRAPAPPPPGPVAERDAPPLAPPPPTAAARAPSSGVWYFCEASNAYYPYVKECPQGWKNVPAVPPAR